MFQNFLQHPCTSQSSCFSEAIDRNVGLARASWDNFATLSLMQVITYIILSFTNLLIFILKLLRFFVTVTPIEKLSQSLKTFCGLKIFFYFLGSII